jgi:hypothetical protein
MTTDRQCTDRLEAGADHAGGDPGRQGGDGDTVTVGAASGVALILGRTDQDGRQVEHLVTARQGSVRREAGRQGSLAVRTGLGEEGDDIMTSLGGFEEAVVPL